MWLTGLSLASFVSRVKFVSHKHGAFAVRISRGPMGLDIYFLVRLVGDKRRNFAVRIFLWAHGPRNRFCACVSRSVTASAKILCVPNGPREKGEMPPGKTSEFASWRM